MVSVLISRLDGPGSSPGWEHCVVFLGKTLIITVPISTQVYKGYQQTYAGVNLTMD